jgi:hypothetical protein
MTGWSFPVTTFDETKKTITDEAKNQGFISDEPKSKGFDELKNKGFDKPKTPGIV